ncbi:MAG: hypothetical protein GX974_03345 [Clostridiales bacterium]|nr:hypothetical protein [Clostridiales bacterium]
MKIFAIGDLHLSGHTPKPMSIFGDHWQGHWDKIKLDWIERVDEEDIVLVPGDISWAMKLDEAQVDLDDIGQLPGKKVMVRGNHDYWWSSISRVRDAMDENIYPLQNDSVKHGNIWFCGSRGWQTPGAREFSDHDEKIFKRELMRLELSLKSVKDDDPIVVLLHYPPFNDRGEITEFVKLMKPYRVEHVVFGHLHGISLKNVVEGYIEGMHFHLVSCDYLDFKLKQIDIV